MKHSLACMLQGLVLAASSLLIGCAQAPLDYPRTASWALSGPEGNRIATALGPQLAAHPAQSGFHLLANGPDALVARLALIDAAERTVDSQCFILEDDSVGDLFLDRVLAAAGRGVRVRLLVDDWNEAGHDRRLAWLGAQPNIEGRLFNPAGSPRWCSLTRPLHYVFGPRRVLKRMHNKSMIVDNTVAIVGGRNIADEYFAASDDYNFGDMDILAAGPIAAQVSVTFDEFWNDRLAIPIEAFVSREQTAGHSLETRRKFEASMAVALCSPYADYLRASGPAKAIEIGQLPLIWADGEVLYDRPGKVLTSIDNNPSAYMVFELKKILDAARTEVMVISPYLVPGESGMECCRQARNRGVAVKVLTNSLASTDEIAPHAGYEKYRADLLRCGVELYEQRPEPHRSGKDRRDHEGSSAGAGLHAKCLIVDRNLVFVGSFNLDPRSAQMDTQNGMIVRSEELASQLAAVFAKRTSGGYAYRVRFLGALRGTNDTRLVWIDEIGGKAVYYSDEPMTGPGRRLKAWYLSWLAPEEWL
jgi:cardiolipin synthase C